MSRRRISIVLGALGLVVSVAMLLGLQVMGSLLADARSEHVMGPGVDVFLLTPFPGPGQRVELEVTARGGSKAGISGIRVLRDGAVLAEHRGPGATWGHRITSGKTRGSKRAVVGFDVPAGVRAGSPLPLRISVSYVVAMKNGPGRFENESRHDEVSLDVRVVSPAQRRVALAGRTARGAALLVAWFLLVWGVAWLLARAEDAGGPTSKEDEELGAIGVVMGVVGGGFVGYWLFARPLLWSWGVRGDAWAAVLTAAWLALPVAWALWWSRHRTRLRRWVCTVPGAPPGPEVDASEPAGWLRRDLGFEVREGDGWLRAARGKERLRLRWSGRRIPVHGLTIETTGVEPALELAHRLAGRVGRLHLAAPTGPGLDVDPATPVPELLAAHSAALLAETLALLERLKALRLPPSRS